jgi:pimeloyl-ACP methyl ester carboxylesterase
MVDAFAPVTHRTIGLANEGAAIDPPARYPLEQITAPALVVHARDDGINPFAFGAYAARHLSKPSSYHCRLEGICCSDIRPEFRRG